MRKKIFSILCVIPFIFGCQHVRELHHFRQDGNYYRLKIKECAFASKSRYISGYYDEYAVDNYFGEIAAPDSVKLAAKVERINGEGEKCGNDNTKLVMILSTNSDVVASQIKTFAKNEETLEMLARLANKDKIEANVELAEELEKQYHTNHIMISLGENLFSDLQPGDSTVNEKKILLYLNQVAVSRGYNGNFEKISDAKNWFNNEF